MFKTMRLYRCLGTVLLLPSVQVMVTVSDIEHESQLICSCHQPPQELEHTSKVSKVHISRLFMNLEFKDVAEAAERCTRGAVSHASSHLTVLRRAHDLTVEGGDILSSSHGEKFLRLEWHI